MRIDIPIDPADIPTAQEKGVRVVKGVPMFYKKAPLVKFESLLEKTLSPLYGKLRIPDGHPASVHITYLFGYPKSTPKRNLVDMARMTKRPDGDNLSKAIVDALGDKYARDKATRRFYIKRRGFFADDGQVNPLVISKFYTTGTPKVVITIKETELLPNP